MRYLINRLLAWGLVLLLAACGGGGGSPGATSQAAGGGTTGTSVTGDQQTTATASMAMEVRSGAGVATNTISAIEISQASVTLNNATGQPVAGVVVTFSEAGAGLLSFSPASKTALTDSQGKATVEIRAAGSSSVGATTVVASATVAGAAITTQKAIGITSAPTTGTADPQALANALNFLDVNPADKSIVLAGAGGNGRSESATLRFRVVDKNNSPVKGAVVTFAVVPSNDVTLNIPSATSDADGVVVTTVSSKSVATAVVIQATVRRTDGSIITSQSDQLLVTTGVATQAGFDMSASKYNLNSRITGDKSIITVRIVDKNGNPVADGVPVVFTTPFGAVGSSSRGGCVTVGGQCAVDYIVQDPRPLDGQQALVTASTQVGDGTSISDTLAFNIVDANLLDLFTADTGGSTVTTLAATTCAKQTFSEFAGTPGGFPAPAGTTITVTAITSGLATTLKSGSPILDQLISPPRRTPVDIEVDLGGLTSNPCVASGTTAATAEFKLLFQAGGVQQERRINVTYKTTP